MKKPQKNTPDPKIITTMRLPPDLVEALNAAAEDDGRSRTSLVIKILNEWVKAKGYDR